MKRKYVEYECDNCGMIDHHSPPYADDFARDAGWIIASGGKHFCKRECRSQYFARKKAHKQAMALGNTP